MNRRLTGIILAFVSGVLFATLPILFRLVNAQGVNLITALALRFSIASALIWLVTLPRGVAPLKLMPAQLGAFVLMGALYIGQSSAYLSSSLRIPVATTSILLYTYPAIVTVLARLFLKEPLTQVKLIALGLTSVGTLLTLGAPEAANDALGVALGIACALIYSAYIIIGAKAQVGVPPQLSSGVITLSAGLLCALFGLGTGQLSLPATGEGWVAVLVLAALSAALPILFFLAGVARIGASQASIISTSELMSTALFGAVFLAQPLDALQIAGGALIFAAVILLSLR
jgi:drug/metabolite transporter (DMT)-like permease